MKGIPLLSLGFKGSDKVKGLLCWAAVRRKDFKNIGGGLARLWGVATGTAVGGARAGWRCGRDVLDKDERWAGGQWQSGSSQGSDKSGRTGGVSDPSSKQTRSWSASKNQDAGWECSALHFHPLQQISRSWAGSSRVLVLILYSSRLYIYLRTRVHQVEGWNRPMPANVNGFSHQTP